jgi:membrane protein DedA with SNARE-associated domain
MTEFLPTAETIIEIIKSAPWHWMVVILFGSAMIEYFFPPFPGDTVLLFGAFLVGNGRFPLFPVFIATTAGGLTGFLLVYLLCYALNPSYEKLKNKAPFNRFSNSFSKIESQFEKWGDLLIALNRFMPGIRAGFFWAAGFTRRDPKKVILLGTISLLVWNGGIMVAGYSVGNNWALFKSLFAAYQKVFLTGMGVLISGTLFYHLRLK